MQLLKMKRKLFQEQSIILRFNNGNQESNQIIGSEDSNETTKARKSSKRELLKNDAWNSYLRKNFDFSQTLTQ